MIEIFTDGSCLKNPGGSGGWAFCFIENDKTVFSLYGGEKSTTNNRMELKAVIESLKFIENINENYKINSDSQVTINCAIGKWKRKANLDLWEEFDCVIKNKKVAFNWVKAHNGNKYNELVDKLAYDFAKKL
jgi:ribonuclease HI